MPRGRRRIGTSLGQSRFSRKKALRRLIMLRDLLIRLFTFVGLTSLSTAMLAVPYLT